MSKYLVGLVLGFAMTLTQAQQISVPAYCVSSQDLQDSLTEWKELPTAQGKSLRKVDKDTVTGKLVIFINPKTGTWTIVEELTKDKFCVIAMGEEFSPVPKDVIKEEKRRQEGL
jgi:hypothetical protein